MSQAVSCYHFWAKRSRGEAKFLPQAGALLGLLDPMFTERDADVVKGIGWGLKTLGRYYPGLAAEWLAQQVARPHRALMLRKAVTRFAITAGASQTRRTPP